MTNTKETYIKWAILPEKGSAREYKTGVWRSGRYPVFYKERCKTRVCLLCWISCPDNCIILEEDGAPSYNDLDYCKGCGICAKVCPLGAYEMKEVD